MLITGAILLLMAYCSASKTLLVRFEQVAFVPGPANTYMMVAFLATAPDHSMSRLASSRSPVQVVAAPVLGARTLMGSLTERPEAARKAWTSETAISVCPI